MDKELQVKLLRALESGEITRVGDSEPTKVDVRLIAASNKDLRSEVRAGNFREDLYYRIYVIPIHIPPLRERREDIPLLIEHFRKKLHTKLKKEIPSFSEETMRRFINYAYPGNVRELEHIIERVCFLGSDDKNLFNDQTEGSDRLLSDSLYNDFLSSTNPLKNAVTRAERDIITYTLKIYDNDHNQTAKKLNIGISSLYRKIKEYGMN